MKFIVRIKVADDSYEDNVFTSRMDALDYVYREGAEHGVDAQLLEINDSNFFKYEYTPKLADLTKYLKSHDIPFEIDSGLNVIINFRDLQIRDI